MMLVAAFVVWMLVGLAGTAMPFGWGSGTAESDPTLRYRVPNGQDPVVVTTSVIKHGYVARLDEHGGTGDRLVVVACPHGEADREQVREAIAEAGTSVDDPAPTRHAVRFVDEP
jgi:hypothetical protein